MCCMCLSHCLQEVCICLIVSPPMAMTKQSTLHLDVPSMPDETVVTCLYLLLQYFSRLLSPMLAQPFCEVLGPVPSAQSPRLWNGGLSPGKLPRRGLTSPCARCALWCCFLGLLVPKSPPKAGSAPPTPWPRCSESMHLGPWPMGPVPIRFPMLPTAWWPGTSAWHT